MSKAYSCTQSDRGMNILLLTLTVFIVYMNATLSGALVIDDLTLIKLVQKVDSITSLYSATNNPKYFRPLGYIAYYFDLKILGSDLAISHLINILIHLFNAILVYRLTLCLVDTPDTRERSAMAAAMIFALHPVNSETVVWLSARFDLLCCSFLLLTILMIIQKPERVPLYLIPAIYGTFLCSLLCKEASLFFPGALSFYYLLERKTSFFRKLLILTAVTLAAITWFILRSGNINGSAGGIGILECLAGFGFYLRKMLYPFPLNFTITSINTPANLLLLFILLIPALLYILRRHSNCRLPLFLMCLALSPPLYAALKGLPWVPYAERYLYIPMTGFAMLAGMLLVQRLKKRSFFPILCLLILLGIPTVKRVIIWMDPITFWMDSVQKSPGFGTPRLPLAMELISEGRLIEAEQQIALAHKNGLKRENAVLFAKEVETALAAAKRKNVKRQTP